MRTILSTLILFFTCRCYPAESWGTENDSARASSIEINWISQYFWRGFFLSGDHPALQASCTYTPTNNLSFDLLSSFNYVSQIQLDEYDLSLSYSKRIFADLETWVSISSYQYKEKELDGIIIDNPSYSSEQELLLGMSTSTKDIAVSVEVGRGLGGQDENHNGGYYLNILASKELDIGMVTSSTRISIDYLTEYGIPSKITNYLLQNSFSLSSGGQFRFTLDVGGVYLPRLESLGRDEEKVQILGGVSISFRW